jgi:hypothetical protein
MGTVRASSNDPSIGATSFVFVPAGQLWHPIGSETVITKWSGPFANTAKHPAEIYVVFLKKTDNSGGQEPSLASDVQKLHELGTDFYYQAHAKPTVDPVNLGYTVAGFDTANKLFKSFPNTTGLFPKGIQTSGCHTESTKFYYFHEKNSAAAYLVAWQSDHLVDIAYIPEKLLTGSFESVLDNMSYYSRGGMWELMEFGSYFYYLSRVPKESTFNDSTTTRQCPSFPKATPSGLEIPPEWTKALDVLKMHN